MRHGTAISTLLLATGLALASSLSISVEDPPLEGAAMSQRAVFARIDSLEAVLPEHGDRLCAQLCYRLGQLYLSLQMPEHNWRALEYLDRALAEDPQDFDIARVRTAAMYGMEYERDARKGLQEMAREHDGDARPHWLLGRIHYRRARTILDPRNFERARQSFLRAAQLDPENPQVLHGLAATQLAQERWPELLATARALQQLLPQEALPDFLLGAALSALDERAEAGQAFERALARSDAATRAVFETGQGFLDAHALGEGLGISVDPQRLRDRIRLLDPDWEHGDRIQTSLAHHALQDPQIRGAAVADYWRQVNIWPSHLLNSRQLRFWQRLVEADILFGDPDGGLRGWETWPGRVLARWGRPDRIHYEPPSFHAHHQAWYDQGVRLPVSEDIPNDQQVLVWTYRRDGNWFSLLFTDVSQRFRWSPANASAESYEERVRTQPMIFFDGESQPQFDFELAQHSYPRANYTRLESSIAVRSEQGFAPFERMVDGEPASSLLTVEWAIFDWTEERVEYVRRELGTSHLRSQLLAALDRDQPSAAQELLCQVNAVLPPGEYRLAIDLSSPSLGHRAQQLRVFVPDPDPPGFLNISDLLLAESFDAIDGASALPLEFVRYAHGVIPRPGRRFASNRAPGFVYFEVYNLVTDDEGLTRFNVHYRIHEVLDQGVPPSGQVLDPSTLSALALNSSLFLEERTGLSVDGHVVKGSALDLSGLPRGDYLLEVQVDDLLARQSTSRFVRFSLAGS